MRSSDGSSSNAAVRGDRPDDALDPSGPSATELHAILAAAATAPSLNNTQPWRCELRGLDVTVFIDEERARSALDPTWSAALFAVGAFAEALRLAARARGFDVVLEPLPWRGPRDAVVVARFGGRRAPSDEDAALEALLHARETNRRVGTGEAVAADVLASLGVVTRPAFRVSWLSERARRLQAADVLGEAAAWLFASPLGQETVDAWRLRRADARGTRDGIDVATLEMDDSGATVLGRLRADPALRERDVEARAGSLRSLALGAGAVGVVVGPASATPQQRLDLGGALLRVWLEAERRGFALQPWAALTTLQWQGGAAGAVTDEAAARLSALERAFAELLSLPEGDVALFAFRLFRGPRASARALRRPPARFVEGFRFEDFAIVTFAPSPPLLLVATADLRALHDESGRPLGEQGAPDAARVGVHTEHRSCPYPGSRHRHARPMNVSTLKQMTQRWDELLASLRWCHALVPGEVEGPSYERAWRAGQLASLIPGFVRHRAERPLEDGALPLPLALTYKVVIGANAVVHALHFDERIAALVEDEAPPPVTAERILEEAEARGALVGPREVCAGPPAMILDALRALLGDGASDARVVEQHEQLIAAWVPDTDALWRYAAAHMDHAVARFLWTLGAAAVVEDLRAWSERPGTLDGVPSESALRERLAALAAELHGNRAGELVTALDEEDRGTLVEHFAATSTNELTRDAFVAALGTPEDDVMATLRRLGSGGPGTPELLLAARRVLALDDALALGLREAEAALRDSLARPPLDRDIADSDLDAARDPRLLRLVEDLLEVRVTRVGGAALVRGRGA